MNYFKTFYRRIFCDFYKIEFIRVFVVIVRFILFFYILKKQKTLYDENKDIKNLIVYLDDKNSTQTTIEKNVFYTKKFFNLKKKYNQFSGRKTLSLLNPISSLDFENKLESKILAIGPRSESELFAIRSQGYLWKNIYGIDLHTYSNLIKLCDMHKMNFKDNTFDTIISGWTLPYSTNKKLAMDEMKRVAKNNAIVAVGFTYLTKELRTKSKDQDFDLYTTDQIKDYFKIKDSNIFFNFDAFKINEKFSRASRIIFRLEK